MKKTLYAVATAALFLSSASFAFASISYNPNGTATPQPAFGFYCNPYSAPFTSGGYYAPASSGNTCTYLLPQAQMASSSIFLAVYQGVPGNATLEEYDYAALPPSSVLQTSPNDWSGSQGQNFFSIAMGYDNFNDVLSENSYLTTGGTDPGFPYSELQWIWGAAPITTAPLTVTADNKSIGFGSSIPSLTATLSGFVSGTTDDVSGSAACTTTATASSTPGTYPITCAQGTLASTNYTFNTFVPGTLTITPAPLTVAANSQTIELGSPLPALTATLSGFVGGDTASSSDVTGSASCSTTATASSIVGSYPITCSAGTLTSTNYTLSTFAPGTLTIVDTTAPSVSITSPQNGATYLQNANVPVTVSITDLSAVATSTYKFDGKLINAASPLPLSSATTGTATLVVSATDAYGNTGYATSTFTVAPVVVDKTPPTITINTPVQNGVYAKTDTVYLTATVTDASPIATTTYWFNNTKINPASPLPLSTVSTPSIQTVSVSATDKYGNTATSTEQIFVVKSTNSCLTDIVSVLTLILQDKKLPSKPTITQLISDCSALLKGQHRGY